MSSGKIQLPDFVVADWYKQHLVLAEPSFPAETPTKTEPAHETEKPAPGGELTYLGTNGKHICIVVHDTGSVHLNDDALQFLSAILAACRLNLGDVAIVNAAKHPLDFTALRKALAPQQVLLFSITARQLGLPFAIPDYQLQSHDQCRFLQAPALERMMGESREAKLEKTKLWVSLKTMFNI
jgi:hypothetical protein